MFGWGRCDYGQLGIITDKYKESRCVPVPTEIEALNGIKQVKKHYTRQSYRKSGNFQVANLL